MGPVDIIRAAEELEEQARILRLIAGDVKGNLILWQRRYEIEVKRNTEKKGNG